MSAWTINITTDWDIIQSSEFQQKWEKLFVESNKTHIFFSPTLVRVWMETYFPLRKIMPLFVWGTSDDNVALFPLVLWKRNWKNGFVRSIVPVGYSDYDYHDPIFLHNNETAINGFWEELLVKLNSFSYDNIIIDGLHSKPQNTLYSMVSTESCPYIKIKDFDNLEAFTNSLDGKFVREIRRNIKRITELGDFSFHIYTKNEKKQALVSLNQMLIQHHKRWPNAYRADNFHNKLIDYGLEKENLWFSEISINAQPISWGIMFKHNAVLYLYIPAYDTAYSKYSIGNINIYYTLKECFRTNICLVDEMRGMEKYKTKWAVSHLTICTVEHQNNGILSKLRLGIKSLKDKLK